MKEAAPRAGDWKLRPTILLVSTMKSSAVGLYRDCRRLAEATWGLRVLAAAWGRVVLGLVER